MLKVFNDFKKQVIDCIKNNSLFSVLIFSAFFIGVVIAVINLITFKEILSFKNLIDVPLYLYIKQDISLFSFFIRKFFLVLLLCIISFLLCTNKFTKYIYLFICVYLGYVIVFNMGIIIICFGFFGFVFAFLITLLLNALYFLVLSLIVLNCNECLCLNNYFINFKNRLPLFLILLGFVLLVALIEMLLTALLSSIFIINFL